jgi:hypothetical protein
MMPNRNMFFRLVLSAGVVAGCAAWSIAPLVAQPPTTDAAPPADAANAAGDSALAAQVRQLLPRLDHDELAERDAAEASLVALGPGVIDWLPDASAAGSAEFQHRLERIRQAIIHHRAAQSVAQSTVTLKVDAVPLVDILAEVQKQTGNQIQDRRGPEAPQPQITLDLADEPFWPTIDAILDQAGLSVYPYASRETLSLVAATPGDAPRVGRAHYNGVFRIDPMRATAMRDLRRPEGDSLTLQLEVSWEPRIRPIVIVQPMDQLTAVDENGDELLIISELASLELPVRSGASAVEIPIQFALPSRQVQSIASLRGTLEIVVPAASEDFRFDLAAGPGQQRRGETTVFVESVRTNNEQLEVRMRARFEGAAGALESHRSWVLDNASYLIDKAGQRVEYGGSESTVRTETEVGFAYFFALPDGPDGATFVYRAPTMIVRTTASYEMTDIPLP